MQIIKTITLVFMSMVWLSTMNLAEASNAPAKKHHKQRRCVEKMGKSCPITMPKKSDGVVPAMPSKEVPTSDNHTKADAAAIVTSVDKKPDVRVDAVLSDADARKLATKSGCFTCHAVEKKVVGPAWKDVAAKYRGDASIEAKLIAKVSKGGSGVWGSVAMPANAPRVSDADIKALVKFVLALK
jgi:cytochrome c